ncbi:hypothetical protein CSQ85_00175 [Bifidobacterium rousetti]|uniref:hypothetical protein n=1 Tax=Bifidobacterium rousetti TaxID=2045439 RepID=UPI00123900D5|nr:hypothetical protein [Bifidobacterium rousetti]KAA8820268.1 hypothetical protein CSQ85_00175 [Bifidobacterium rousetti]
MRAKGTATGWASCDARITLEAGDYELSATTPNSGVYASLIKTSETSSTLSTLTANPNRGTVDAGTYLMRAGVVSHVTVDATITPTLTRIT